MAIFIRPVEAAEVSAVIDLVTRVLGEFEISFGEGSPTDEALRWLPGSYLEHGGSFWVGTDDDDRIIGTVAVMPMGDEICELRKMYIDPTVRGAGIGQQLLDVALAWARGRKFRAIVLDTTDEMAAAIRLYEKNGFVRDDRYLSSPRCARGYRKELA